MIITVQVRDTSSGVSISISQDGERGGASYHEVSTREEYEHLCELMAETIYTQMATFTPKCLLKDRECPTCNGRGKVSTKVQIRYVKCEPCNGKGYF